MIRLHCSKALYDKLPLRDSGRLLSKRPSPYSANDEPETRLSGWHAKPIVLQRRQCLLFVHDATRFPVFMIGVKMSDFAELDHRFEDHFMNTLLKTGADDPLMRAAHAQVGPLVCDTTNNRSVQGTLNHMGQDIKFMLEYEGAKVMDLSPYRVGAWLADRPCRGKDLGGYVFPIKAMHEWLQHPSTAVLRDDASRP